MLSLSLFTCTDSIRDEDEQKKIIVTLTDLTGLDGCGWAFITTEDKKLEPVNLHQFTIDLHENDHYLITYELVEGGSICMVGSMISINSIEKYDQ